MSATRQSSRPNSLEDEWNRGNKELRITKKYNIDVLFIWLLSAEEHYRLLPRRLSGVAYAPLLRFFTKLVQFIHSQLLSSDVFHNFGSPWGSRRVLEGLMTRVIVIVKFVDGQVLADGFSLSIPTGRFGKERVSPSSKPSGDLLQHSHVFFVVPPVKLDLALLRHLQAHH